MHLPQTSSLSTPRPFPSAPKKRLKTVPEYVSKKPVNKHLHGLNNARHPNTSQYFLTPNTQSYVQLFVRLLPCRFVPFHQAISHPAVTKEKPPRTTVFPREELMISNFVDVNLSLKQTLNCSREGTGEGVDREDFKQSYKF